MTTYSLEELKRNPGKWDECMAPRRQMVITSGGRPSAIVLGIGDINDTELREMLDGMSLSVKLGEARSRIAKENLFMSDEEIEAGIQAVRREMAAERAAAQ